MDLKRYVHGYSVESLNVKRDEEFEAEKVPRWRRLLSQFAAGMSINLILFDIGLAVSYPTFIVAAFQSQQNDTQYNGTRTYEHHNGGFGYNSSHVGTNFTLVESIHHDAQVHQGNFPELSIFKHYTLTEQDLTWYVSITYLFQPLGSILGGSIIGLIGRKRLMQILNLFMFCAWILPFFSTSPVFMYFSNILFGIGIGCGESPIATYIGEVTEVSSRGVILTFSQVFLSVSFLVPYLVSLVVTSWRWLALVLSSVPLLTLIVCSLVPETPAWLISKSRHKEAEASLKWVRGWTTSNQVKEELEQMTAYHLDTNKPNRQLSTATSSHQSTEELMERGWLKDNLSYFFSARMRRPFIIICIMFALIYITGMGTIRPYLVPLFKDMGINMDGDKCALWVTLAGVVGNIGSLCLVKYTGKRFIVLSGLSGSAACTLVIALISMDILPTHWSFIMFLGISFFNGYGITPIPWILQGELYPFRGRGFAGGVGAAFSYIVGFIFTKSYVNLVDLMQLQGLFIMFTCFAIFGLIYLWIRLPETEGKSYEEIDQHFNRLNKNEIDE